MPAATFRLNAQGKRRDKTQANALAGWRAASHHWQQAEIGRGERMRVHFFDHPEGPENRR